ncbi:DNA polymerase III subunit gamma/tau [Candidatus Kinetoplastibacterium oncopeltii TCC290E]|uniref:DNA polymerase III subunit gamma/tau n=1 Tax=Candidatus Kinetoplastidibacterium stringomonadis TCC290E TaxID=1208920 RepID=M1LVQ2_9PROT|nr:DNA polymerase III subunit gamma/tau [Candidatus Kinetoplastibacterium oncopeltii]AGF48161.1 DNA polymerase III subunit gamma/tau [Candidatus Kinetoplastibacterium oncopeltii TCC290E]
MNCLALARKWRPTNFHDVLGQEHVVNTLVNSLDTKRLHHAWLFSGTRGVGKTTLARILAKSLNCEKGITSKPCGICVSCIGIDEGNSVDYLEMDAASNRGVEDMAILLDKVTYSPVLGRYKVYLIDEVHMLTGHAFNSMLKTLEDPPNHVKFILATTDPQKIPITIISRCMHFNLRPMSTKVISDLLEKILTKESVSYDISALSIISRFAKGSMRDALSLTDQAISYSDGYITDRSLMSILGIVGKNHLVRIFDALITCNSLDIIKISNELQVSGLSYENVLSEFALMLSQLMIIKEAPSLNDDNLFFYMPQIKEIVKKVPFDLISLLYSVTLNSISELDKTPDSYYGFIVVLFRLISLIKSSDINIVGDNILENFGNNVYETCLDVKNCSDVYNDNKLHNNSALNATSIVKEGSISNISKKLVLEQVKNNDMDSIKLLECMSIHTWGDFVNKLPVSGLAGELARHSEWIDFDGSSIFIKVSSKALFGYSTKMRLKTILCEYLGTVVDLVVTLDVTGDKTAHAISQMEEESKKSKLKEAINDNKFIKNINNLLDGVVMEDTICSINH